MGVVETSAKMQFSAALRREAASLSRSPSRSQRSLKLKIAKGRRSHTHGGRYRDAAEYNRLYRRAK
jgi:hypothetical protein